MLFAVSIVVLLIGEGLDDPRVLAFDRAASGVLGGKPQVTLVAVPEDPPDEESAARAGDADGVVELTWSADGRSAKLHCYLERERRWVDREISFGSAPVDSVRDAEERGRTLGFAAASMFAEQRDPPAMPPPPPPAPEKTAVAVTLSPPKVAANRSELEFAGTASTGLGGTASGFGAVAGLRWKLHQPWWARAAIGGRMGSIPAAQATTRSVLLEAGVAWSALDSPSSRWVVGARMDAYVSYFEASHFSEDDVEPDPRSRWLPGLGLLAEVGYRFAGKTGLFAAAGPELMAGKTEVYTHGKRVAVVPALRAAAEIGFRAGF